MSEPTNGELNIMVGNIRERLEDHIVDSKEFRDEVMEAIKENTRIGQQTLEQAIKTNGRVNSLDSWRKDSVDPSVKQFVTYKNYVIGSIFVISLFGTIFYSLYIDKIKGDIAKEVNDNLIKTLEDNYYIQFK